MKKIKDILGKVLLSIRKTFNKLCQLFKTLFKTKQSKIIGLVVFSVIFIVVLVALFPHGKKDKFALDGYYEFLPSEVRKVYSNLVKVSCGGDLKFSTDVGAGEKKVSELSKNNLLDYMFSYLDKNGELTDKMDDSVIRKTAKKLFYEDVDLLNDIKNYNYGEYTYNLDRGKITRKKHECEVSDTKHVLHLYGFNSDKNNLYIDVNVAYLKDGILYDYDNKQLGEYDESVAKLQGLTGETSYYHITYVREDNEYKLVSVDWRNRT